LFALFVQLPQHHTRVSIELQHIFLNSNALDVVRRVIIVTAIACMQRSFFIIANIILVWFLSST
jgi:hypothetical protein